MIVKKQREKDWVKLYLAAPFDPTKKILPQCLANLTQPIGIQTTLYMIGLELFELFCAFL